MPRPKILLVEDSEDDVFFFKRSLKRAQADVDLQVASDGSKAIAYLSHEGPPSPDAIFLDLKMPNQNGFEVLEWIRQHPPLSNAKVYILTSSSQPGERERAKELGANDYFLKPLAPDLLRDALSRL